MRDAKVCKVGNARSELIGVDFRATRASYCSLHTRPNVKQITADTMDTFPTNEDHGIVDRVARDRAPQAKRWWAKSCGCEKKGDLPQCTSGPISLAGKRITAARSTGEI